MQKRNLGKAVSRSRLIFKEKILSSFIRLFINQYDFLFLAEHFTLNNPQEMKVIQVLNDMGVNK